MGILRRFIYRAVKAVRLLNALALGASSLKRNDIPLYLDIGARGGLPRHWSLASKFGLITPVFCEPDTGEVDQLRRRFPRCDIIPHALGSTSESRILYVTREPGRSSLFKPDVRKLARFQSDQWDIVAELPVDVVRLDSVWNKHASRPPSFVKIDVQGFELEILKGFGRLLSGVRGIELECVYERLYETQPLFAEIHEYLSENGFDLVKQSPVGLFNSAIIEFNAFWVRMGTHSEPAVVFWKAMNNVPSQERVVALGY